MEFAILLPPAAVITGCAIKYLVGPVMDWREVTNFAARVYLYAGLIIAVICTHLIIK